VIDTGADGCLFEKKRKKKTLKGVGKIQQHSYGEGEKHGNFFQQQE
jgi:hypothetical protein